MKNTLKISPTTIVMLVMLLVALLYVFLYFVPAQSELNLIRVETTVANAEMAAYKAYLADTTPLENDIAAIQAEIDELNSSGYTNDSTVSLVISDAIQRYSVSLASVTLSSVTNIDGNNALPISVSVTGTLENILAFISHFENNEAGSYLVRAASMEINGERCTADLVIYLCTPAV